MISIPPIVLVAGSRHATDESLISGALTVIHRQHPDAVLFTCDVEGAEGIAARSWARLVGFPSVRAAVDDGRIRLFNPQWTLPCFDDCPPGHRKASPSGNGTCCPDARTERDDRMCQVAARAQAEGIPVVTVAVWKAGMPGRSTKDAVTIMNRHGLPDPVHLTEASARA